MNGPRLARKLVSEEQMTLDWQVLLLASIAIPLSVANTGVSLTTDEPANEEGKRVSPRGTEMGAKTQSV